MQETEQCDRNYAMKAILAATVALVVLALTMFAGDEQITREDFNLHFSVEGSGKPVVFLSGGPGQSVEYMKEVAQLFPPGYQHIFLEQRGTGRSRPPKLSSEKLSLRLYVEDLEALRQHLKVDRLLLVGHSWGSILAMAYASSYPGKVEQLTAIAPGGVSPEFHQWYSDNIFARLHTQDKEVITYWRSALQQGVDRDLATSEMVRAAFLGYFYDRSKALAWTARLPKGFLSAAVADIMIPVLTKTFDIRASLSRIDCPVFIIQGYQDPVGQKPVEEMHSLIKSSTLRYIPKSGHFPRVEQPDQIRTALREFLSSHGAVH